VDEIKSLRDIFDLFDKEKTCPIDLRYIEAIMMSLQCDPAETRLLLNPIQEAAGSLDEHSTRA
jgi:Ca2+-binding EF-hand superfamily protein